MTLPLRSFLSAIGVDAFDFPERVTNALILAINHKTSSADHRKEVYFLS